MWRNRIEYYFKMIPECDILPVKYKYLFYNDYDENNTDFNIIDDLDLFKK